jgi:hypothetical protein
MNSSLKGGRVKEPGRWFEPGSGPEYSGSGPFLPISAFRNAWIDSRYDQKPGWMCNGSYLLWSTTLVKSIIMD